MSDPLPAVPDHGPELVFALAGAVGTDLRLVERTLSQALIDVGYIPISVGLSDLLDEVDWSAREDAPRTDDTTTDLHIETRMEAGDRLREVLRRGDAVALLGIYKIAMSLRGDLRNPRQRCAYILRSLKHPDEVRMLREVYGQHFFLVSAYAPDDVRADRLSRQFAVEWERHPRADSVSPKGRAWDLIERDRVEAGRKLGQHLGKTFPMADFFVDARASQRLEEQVNRLIELLFDHPFHTPTRDESAMFHAQAAALRSSAPGRQVGAVIATPDGDLVAVGTNEVPRPHGGQYWADDDPDHRDHRRDDPDVSGSEKKTVAEQVLRRLNERGWLREEHLGASPEDFYNLLDGLRLHTLIEFERAVHAEMAAIVDAARRGVAIGGSYLYTTTFPCHECARHVVAAGVRRVVYIEPYPKSLAPRLHDDAIAIDEDDPSPGKVRFEPFVGVGPRKFLDLFTAHEGLRKDETGKVAAARAGWFPKGLAVREVVVEEVTIEPPEGGSKPGSMEGSGAEKETVASEAASEVTSDAPVTVVEHTFVSTSDRLYMVREKNILTEFYAALSEKRLELVSETEREA